MKTFCCTACGKNYEITDEEVVLRAVFNEADELCPVCMYKKYKDKER